LQAIDCCANKLASKAFGSDLGVQETFNHTIIKVHKHCRRNLWFSSSNSWRKKLGKVGCCDEETVWGTRFTGDCAKHLSRYTVMMNLLTVTGSNLNKIEAFKGQMM